MCGPALENSQSLHWNISGDVSHFLNTWWLVSRRSWNLQNWHDGDPDHGDSSHSPWHLAEFTARKQRLVWQDLEANSRCGCQGVPHPKRQLVAKMIETHISKFTFPLSVHIQGILKTNNFANIKSNIKHQMGCVKTSEYQFGSSEPSFLS